ncbi:hypothetical protein SELMODRAFT_61782, partial [Selaginella moellendorffii]
RAAHRELQRLGIDQDTYLGNLLVQMYGKCGYVEEAMAVFQRIKDRNVFSWTILMDACTENGLSELTLELFRRMLLEGIRPDRVAYLGVLKACSELRYLEEGREVENLLVSGSCFPSSLDPAVLTSLLNLYASCGSLENARRVFESFHEKDLVCWNSMLAAYAKHEKTGRQTLEFFQKMLLEGVAANVVSFTCVVGACSRPELSEQGTVVHEQITCSGLVADSFLAAALVNMYSKCGRLGSAWELFQRVDVKMSLVSWNSILAAHAQRADLTKVLEIFGMLQLEGLKPSGVTLISVLGACCSTQALRIVEHIYERVAQVGELSHDLFLGTALMTSFCDCGKLADAESLFYRLNRWNAASWNTMIAGYVQHGFDLQALHLLYEMDLEGIKPNVVTFLGIVDACSSLAVLGNAKAVHERISASKVGLDTVLGTAIVSMYANCDSLEDSRRVFESLDLRDTVSWNAVIAAYAEQGHAYQVLESFRCMIHQGLKPDNDTFIFVLHACSHAGSVEQACDLFNSITRDHNLHPAIQHYVCVIDLLGRAGWLENAHELINRMPYQPNSLAWSTLLGAC